MHIIKRITLCLAVVLFTCCLSVSKHDTLIPDWVELHSLNEELTIQGEVVSVLLSSGCLRLYTSGETVYRSPQEWFVADFFVEDIDRDDSDEVLLHVWKPGSFGQYQPFWLEKEDKTIYSEHLFIYEWDVERADRLDPKWMSSAMPVEGRSIFVEKDGKIHVVSANEETVWMWESWGLTLQETSLSLYNK